MTSMDLVYGASKIHYTTQCNTEIGQEGTISYRAQTNSTTDDPETLETEGVAPWVPLDGISAHPKLDEATGELMFFNYSKHPPYMHYGVVDRAGKLAAEMGMCRIGGSRVGA